MNKDDTLAAYRDFTKWCRDNPSLDLDSRPHSHGGPIGDGGYISDEKTRVAFAAWRAAIEADLQSQDREDAERWRAAKRLWRAFRIETFPGVIVANRKGIPWPDLETQVDIAIDHARRIEGEGK